MKHGKVRMKSSKIARGWGLGGRKLVHENGMANGVICSLMALAQIHDWLGLVLGPFGLSTVE